MVATTVLDFKKIEKISKALGDPYRLQIIEAIKKNCSAPMPCSNVVSIVNLSQPAISHHMKLLIDADLVMAEKEGREMKYSINKGVFAAYTTYLKSFLEGNDLSIHLNI